jgi:TRAP-type C4-dicarboxylate transport system permease small subunit
VDSEERFNRAARPFGLVAALVLVFMMLLTVVAVLSRQLFNIPLLGLVELSEIALVICIFVAMPGVFLRDENVTVDVIDHVISRKARVALRALGLVLALVFLAMMMVNMLPQALDKWQFNEVTMTLSINRFIHWTPIIFGFAMSILGTAWVLYRYVRTGFPRDPNLDREPYE